MTLSILAVVLTFGLVIFLHEFGHFLVFKKLGIRVERFAFGFGPELIGMTRGETRFSVCAIPLGGYVKPAGESLEDATGHPDEYYSRSPWQRILIVVAGPAMNYVLAFAVFFGVIFARGLPTPTDEPVLGDIAADFPAAAAGLKQGDRILKVDGVEVARWDEMAAVIHRSPDRTVDVVFSRDGTVSTARMTPRLDKPSGHGLIGILPAMRYAKLGLLGSIQEGARQCWFWTRYMIQTLAEKIYRREKPDLAGPVGIVHMISKAAHSGIEDLVFLIGLISVAIGFFNLLPIPLLDGGHAVLYLWEGITRRKLTAKLMAAANSVGLALLLSLLVFATYNDVLRIRDQRAADKAAEKTAAEQPEQAEQPK